MTIIENRLLNNQAYINFSSDVSLTFECPYSIYGTCHNYSAASKPLRLIVPNTHSDYIFISTSQSIGVLFTTASKIYITKPVYEQILLKYEEFPRRLSYEDAEISNSDRIVSIEDVDLHSFMNKCIFISFNEIVQFIDIKVQCVPSGTFIGWCNYYVLTDCNTSYFIVKTISTTEGMAQRAVIKSCDYLLFYGDDSNDIPTTIPIHRENSLDFSLDSENDLVEFNAIQINTIENLYSIIISHMKEKEPILITIDVTSEFMCLIFMLYDIIRINRTKIRISLCSRIFKKFETIINVQSEWFSDVLIQRAYKGESIVDFRDYRLFEHHDSIYDIVDLPDVLFVSALDYTLFGVDRYFDKQVLISMDRGQCDANYQLQNWYNSCIDNIIDLFKLTHILTSFKHKNTQQLVPNSFYCIEDTKNTHEITFINSDMINLIENTTNQSFFIEGEATQKDSKISITNKKDTLSKIFTHQRFAYINGKYFFFSENLVVHFEDNNCFLNNIKENLLPR